MRFVLRLTLGTALTSTAATAGLTCRPLEDRSGPPLLPESALETVAETESPPGNVAVLRDGRVFVTMHPEGKPDFALAELRGGEARPLEIAVADWRTPLGIAAGEDGDLWVLDHGTHGIARPSLVSFDPDSLAIRFRNVFSRAAAGLGAMLNDFRLTRGFAFVADQGVVNRRPALVVHELASGRSRRLFRGRGFMKADGCVTIEGRKHTAASLLLGGMDAVAVDPAGEWLYFSPLTSGRLYRAPTAALQDFSRDEDSLAALVEDVGAKTMSDGMAFDPEGSLYMTDFEHSAIVRRRPDGALETVVRSPELLRWPDGVAFGPDGSLYVTASDVGRAMLSTKKRVRERGPYRVLRVSGEALRGSLR